MHTKDKCYLPKLDIQDEHRLYLGFLEDVVKNIERLGILECHFGNCVCEVIALDSKSMHKLNRTYMSKDSTTDVLSFPLAGNFDFDNLGILQDSHVLCHTIGSIAINYELAKTVAAKLGHSEQEEITLLFIHGLLHILGYDHERDNGEQRALEQKIIESLGLGKSLIVRSGI